MVATLVWRDRRPAWPKNNYFRIGGALRDIEKQYGLQVVFRVDRTAARGLTRPEMERHAVGREPEVMCVTGRTRRRAPRKAGLEGGQ